MTLYTPDPTMVRASCKVICTVAQSIANATVVKIIWDTAVFDNNSFWSAGAPTRITFATAGFYQIMVTPVWAASAGGSLRLAFISKNGTTHRDVQNELVRSASILATENLATCMSVSATDYIEVSLFHDAGSALLLSTNGGLANPCEISACQVSA